MNNYNSIIYRLKEIKPSYQTSTGLAITGLNNSGSLPSTDTVNKINELTGKLAYILSSDNRGELNGVLDQLEGNLRLLITLNEMDSAKAEELIRDLRNIN
jgi:hypothetical protein